MPSSPQTRRGVKRATRATVVLALLVTVGIYIWLRHSVPVLEPSSCSADTSGRPVTFDVSQAGIAATIAGVAQRHSMPRRAVTIAYATALQESKLTNLYGGDRDSVGVFQQRPSAGWGPASKLEDPVYATTKFFDALARVPDYTTLPVYRAAQAVQRSADGYAYNQYAPVAQRMSGAFTGVLPHAVWCVYPGAAAKPRLAAADRALSRAFGPLNTSRYHDPAVAVQVAQPPSGWAIAAWLVSHAGTYGIRHISYQGYQWEVGHGGRGWIRNNQSGQVKAPPTAVVFG